MVDAAAGLDPSVPAPVPDVAWDGPSPVFDDDPVPGRRQAGRRKTTRGLSIAVSGLLAVTVLLSGIAGLGSLAGWWKADAVLTGSMRPAINPGDLEVLQPEPVAALRVGQVVAFHPPSLDATVSHRVIDVVRSGSTVYVKTKGDANNAPDPWGLVRVEGSRVWVVTHVVPKAGSLSIWVRQPIVLLAIWLALIVIFSGWAVGRIWDRP